MQTDNSAIADTVAAVFRGRAFAIHPPVSLGQIVLEWLWNFIIRVLGFTADHPGIAIVIRVALLLALAAFAVRVAYGLMLRRSPAIGLRRSHESRQASDWWSVADDLAARDDWTAAAHALYMALVTAAARTGALSIHDSKTTGDYLREARRRAGAFDITRFAEFTQSYETVIYGAGTCDPRRYTTLREIAARILGRDTATARKAS